MNNGFKVNVDEQQDDIKHLKEYWDIDDIEPLWKEMDVCVTCNQNNCKGKFVEKSYPGKAHWAVVKL